MERSQSKNHKKIKKSENFIKKISDVVSQEITLKCQFFYLYVRCSLSFRKALRIVSFGSSFELFGLIATTKFDFNSTSREYFFLVDKTSGHIEKMLQYATNL